MLRRVELEEYAAPERVAGAPPEALVTAVADAGGDLPALPHDHPRWVKDAVALSARARELASRLRPLVIRVLGFWDHRIRATFVGGRCVRVEPSGCYRIE